MLCINFLTKRESKKFRKYDNIKMFSSLLTLVFKSAYACSPYPSPYFNLVILAYLSVVDLSFW